MKFSENWLRELVAIDADRATLVHALTMAGLEVEEVTPLGEHLDGVVVAEIVEAVKHPEADRLSDLMVEARNKRRVRLRIMRRHLKLFGWRNYGHYLAHHVKETAKLPEKRLRRGAES